MSEVTHVRRAAVLGAGVMGAQIAAHLVNAGVRAVLFELPAEGSEPNAHVQRAIERLRKLQPSPLASAAHAEL
ncbi:MAG: 3-hydroxyacyl-CoA dehydrogenase NAD-binding domain-containing protein, partial [Nitrococcus sp.]|nr:3-hydroxyacyl-CoA dehydrogenase NAD-binding domain-containing protein [Nitrococcus sp.]